MPRKARRRVRAKGGPRSRAMRGHEDRFAEALLPAFEKLERRVLSLIQELLPALLTFAEGDPITRGDYVAKRASDAFLEDVLAIALLSEIRLDALRERAAMTARVMGRQLDEQTFVRIASRYAQERAFDRTVFPQIAETTRGLLAGKISMAFEQRWDRMRLESEIRSLFRGTAEKPGLLDWKVRQIARTEIATASRAAGLLTAETYAANADMMVRRVYWIPLPSACDFCVQVAADAELRVVTVAEAMEIDAERHANCECEEEFELVPLEALESAYKVHTLRMNLSLRDEIFEGRRYVVAPAIIMVEGVHNEIFYSFEELSHNPMIWNGRPVTLGHPREGGTYVSANDPDTLQRVGMGFLASTTADPAIRGLRTEIWFDAGKTERLSPGLISSLRADDQIDVSIGVYTEDDGVSGKWHGEEFYTAAHNLASDHLAVLPGGQGACSWADRCGIRANDEKEVALKVNVMGSARKPKFDGTESTSWADVARGFSDFRDAYYQAKGLAAPENAPQRIQDAPAAMKKWIASHTLLGDPGATTERDLTYFAVVNPKTGKLNEGALRSILGGRTAKAKIPEDAKASAQKMAHQLLMKHFALPKPNSGSWHQRQLRAMVYRLAPGLGLQVSELSFTEIEQKIQEQLNALDNETWSHWIREVYTDRVIYVARGSNPSEVGGAASVTKLYSVSYALDEEGLVTLGEDPVEVREEHGYVPVAADATVNAAKTATKAGTPAPKKEEEMDKKQLVDTLIACECNDLKEADRDWLMKLNEPQLQAMRVKEPQKPETPKPNDQKPEGQKPDPKPIALEDLPENVREVVRRANEWEAARKATLISKIKENQANPYSEDELKAFKLDALEKLARLARVPDYSGAPGVTVNDKSDEVPAMPKAFEDLTGKAYKEARFKKAGV